MSIENKPIALVTGAPGSGKTALLVDFIEKAAKKGRPIIQVGIPELKISHVPPAPDLKDWTELREDPDMPGQILPYFTFPENSLVVLSEAQRLYRPRNAASKLPDYVAAFETCRHTGVTFVLDTQHPDFIDSHIRKLVGQHIHLIDHGVFGRKHYEWPYVGNPEYFKSAPIKKPYKLPVHIFGLYKSSSLHIKRQYTFPPALKVFIGLMLAIGVGGWLVGHKLWDKFHVAEGAQVLASAEKPATSQTNPAGQVTPSPVTPESLAFEFNPRVPGRPETAPAYDALRQVKNMPVVVGCIETIKYCRCQTQSGNDAGLDDMQCRNWMKNPPFDAYRDQTTVSQSVVTQDQPGIAASARASPVLKPIDVAASPAV